MINMKKSLIFISLLLILCISLNAVSADDYQIVDIDNGDITMKYNNKSNYHINYNDKYEFNITLTPSEDKEYDKYGGVIPKYIKGKNIVKNMKAFQTYKVKRAVKVPVYKKITKKVKNKYVTKKVIKGYKKIYKYITDSKTKYVKTTLKVGYCIVRGESKCMPNSITVIYEPVKWKLDNGWSINGNYDVTLEITNTFFK